MSRPNEPDIEQNETKAEQSETKAEQEKETSSSPDTYAYAVKRTRVKHDEKSVYDEVGDYKFLKSRSSRHSHKKRSGKGKSLSHHSHKRRKKMKTWKKVLIIVGSVLLSLVILVTGVTVFLVNKGRSELVEPNPEIFNPQKVEAEIQDDGKFIHYNGAIYKYNEDVTNVLFMGVDKREIERLNDEGTGGQSDANVMIAMNLKTHKITMIAIPRDLMTDVALYTPGGTYNGMENMQICMAYAYGDGKEKSCENMLSSVKNVFYNIPVKTYYSLDLEGIIAINDAVGGVDVVSPETLGTRLVKGESYHLEGEMAEVFVRQRDMEHIEGTANRMERQKIYVKSFISTLLSQTKKDISTPVNLFNESAPYSCTNLNPSKIAYLTKEFVLGGNLETEMITIPGNRTISSKTGYTEFKLDEKAFFEQFLSVYYEKM